jgi:hypothetical protein
MVEFLVDVSCPGGLDQVQQPEVKFGDHTLVVSREAIEGEEQEFNFPTSFLSQPRGYPQALRFFQGKPVFDKPFKRKNFLRRVLKLQPQNDRG